LSQIQQLLNRKKKIVKCDVLPSRFAQNFFQIPHGNELQPFSIRDQPYFYQVYDTPAQKTLLMSGRQIGKSTSIGNSIIINAILRKFFKIMYVAPRQSQTADFSKDRIKQPLDWSVGLDKFQLNRGAKDNTFYKEFLTGSTLRLLSAYLSADALRGKSADLVAVDELQDILSLNLPIIEECMFRSLFKIYKYSGTPKTETNTLAQYWRKYSTQNEWLIPCDHCGGGDYRYWNLPGEDNIGPNCLVCAKCRREINPAHPSAGWVSMNPRPNLEIPFEGFRIPQIITPTVHWPDLLDKRSKYPRFQFMNEVLALPYDMGTKPITQAEIQAICVPNLSFHSDDFTYGPSWLDEHCTTNPVYMGVDWGTSENSYTVITLCTYLGGFLTFVYYRRCIGEEAEPQKQLALIEYLVQRYRVQMIGADYGGGFDRNDALVRMFGQNRLCKYQYAAQMKGFIRFEPALGRYLVHRSELMSCLFNAMRNGMVRLPRWDEMVEPFAEDMLSISADWNEALRMVMFDKPVANTDDSFHATLYGMLASMIKQPRHDILHGGYAFTKNVAENRKPMEWPPPPS